MTATLGADVIRAADGSGPVEFPDGIITGQVNGSSVVAPSDVASAITTHNADASAHGLTANISAGLSGAASPTALNPFATMADVSAGGRGYQPELVVASDGTGDYTTIAAALAALPAGGATIKIKRGTYAGGVTLSVANTRIIGEGRDLVTIQSPLSNVPCITVTAANVTLEEFTVDGRRASQNLANIQAMGIYIDHVDEPVIRRVRVKNTVAYGILAIGSNDGLIKKCKVENIATNGTTPTLSPVWEGIKLQGGCNRWRVIENYITGWSQAIGAWWGVSESTFALNTLIANYGYATIAPNLTRSAIEDYGAGTDVNVHNVWAYNIIDGATSFNIECAQGVTHSEFIGNYCSGNYNAFGDNTGGQMNIVSQEGQITQDIVVRDNYFIGSATHLGCGILTNGIRDLIEGNTFINHAMQTVITETGPDCRIINNTFCGCKNPITLDIVNTQTGTINNNVFIESLADGQRVISINSGSNVVVEGNTFRRTTAYAGGYSQIYIDASAGDGHIIRTNRFFIINSVEAGEAVACFRGACVIEDNFYDGAYIPIILTGSSALRNVVRHNRFISSNMYGPYIQNGADYNLVQENWLDSTSSITVSGVGTHNTIEPNFTATLTKPSTLKALGAQTVNTTETAVAHGLGYAPTVILPFATSNNTIYQSKAADATNIYLKADADSSTCIVYVR